VSGHYNALAIGNDVGFNSELPRSYVSEREECDLLTRPQYLVYFCNLGALGHNPLCIFAIFLGSKTILL
jgi:hypothetical protein